MNKKMMIMAVAMVLCIVCTLGVTLAYLTSKTGDVTNTFTVGNVTITLDEAKVDVYGEKDGNTRVTANTYKLIPGHTYVKDPTVHVAANSEACYVFVKVVDGISAIEADATIVAQIAAKGWTALDGVANVYYKAVDANTVVQDLVVFENFTLKSDADVTAYTNATITITAYAIQQDGMDNAKDAWTKGGFR